LRSRFMAPLLLFASLKRSRTSLFRVFAIAECA
jgi:hypothetical protein